MIYSTLWLKWHWIVSTLTLKLNCSHSPHVPLAAGLWISVFTLCTIQTTTWRSWFFICSAVVVMSHCNWLSSNVTGCINHHTLCLHSPSARLLATTWYLLGAIPERHLPMDQKHLRSLSTLWVRVFCCTVHNKYIHYISDSRTIYCLILIHNMSHHTWLIATTLIIIFTVPLWDGFHDYIQHITSGCDFCALL